MVFCNPAHHSGRPVGKFMLTQIAACGTGGGLIAQRTRVALAQAKLHGVKLGQPHNSVPARLTQPKLQPPTKPRRRRARQMCCR